MSSSPPAASSDPLKQLSVEEADVNMIISDSEHEDAASDIEMDVLITTSLKLIKKTFRRRKKLDKQAADLAKSTRVAAGTDDASEEAAGEAADSRKGKSWSPEEDATLWLHLERRRTGVKITNKELVEHLNGRTLIAVTQRISHLNKLKRQSDPVEPSPDAGTVVPPKPKASNSKLAPSKVPDRVDSTKAKLLAMGVRTIPLELPVASGSGSGAGSNAKLYPMFGKAKPAVGPSATVIPSSYTIPLKKEKKDKGKGKAQGPTPPESDPEIDGWTRKDDKELLINGRMIWTDHKIMDPHDARWQKLAIKVKGENANVDECRIRYLDLVQSYKNVTSKSTAPGGITSKSTIKNKPILARPLSPTSKPRKDFAQVAGSPRRNAPRSATNSPRPSSASKPTSLADKALEIKEPEAKERILGEKPKKRLSEAEKEEGGPTKKIKSVLKA
ncbi:hypothetical protein P7C70_g334, partial [Phenoliferia sp. Uapishka_3]